MNHDPRYNPQCWIARHGRIDGWPTMPPCDGQLIRAHLIPRQLLLRELPAEMAAGVINDPRTWVMACGGPIGNAGHHGMLDVSKRVRIPRRRLPPDLEALAVELDRVASMHPAWRPRSRTPFQSYLDRTFGPVPEVADAV
jgi:hypothetical protein